MTRAPWLGMERTRPWLSRRANASRTGLRLTPSLAAYDTLLESEVAHVG